MKHTPKPWHIEKGQFSSTWFIHHSGSEVCMIPSHTMSQEANAHLIAAAPELLQACEEAVQDLEATSNGHGDERLTVAKLKVAIKKATTDFPGVWGGIKSQIKALQEQYRALVNGEPDPMLSLSLDGPAISNAESDDK